MATKTAPSAHADAFTSEPYCGNPACVVLLEQPADENWMQKVALEMNLSETAYLVPRKDPSNFDLRWFTPTCEVDLCGHATLASSHVLWDVHSVDKTVPVQFHTKSGVLTATRDESGFIELDFPSEPASAIPDDDADRAQLLPSFGLEAADVLWVGRNRMDVLAEVTPAAFARLKPVFSEVAKITCRVLSVTAAGCPIPNGGNDDILYDFSSRAFGPCAGIDEDPVCGSAHCMLGPYWSSKLGGKTELQARAASKRGGHVRVRLADKRVKLGGRAVTTMTGTLLQRVDASA
jgi:PhzF family phenazine biosynthesis protein